MGNMPKIRLNDCPFCGGSAEMLTIMGGYRIRCINCDANVHELTDYKKQAAAKWNKRFDLSKLKASPLNYNLNNNIIIDLNEAGWNKLTDILQATYKFNNIKNLAAYIDHRKTVDGKYKDQMWEIFTTFGDLFFNGSTYLNSTNIILCDNKD